MTTVADVDLHRSLTSSFLSKLAENFNAILIMIALALVHDVVAEQGKVFWTWKCREQL